MTDVTTQIRDYLDTISTPVTLEEIMTHPVTPRVTPSRMRSGPLVAVAAAAAVVVFGAIAVLLQADNQAPAGPFTVVEEVVAGSEADSFYAVGFDRDGHICAETGASHNSQASCGPGDRLSLTGMAYQGETSVALAGWAPTSIGNLTVVYNGELRRPLELTLIPGHDVYAFGAVETIQARFVEIEVTDDNGEIIQRYFPSFGPNQTNQGP